MSAAAREEAPDWRTANRAGLAQVFATLRTALTEGDAAPLAQGDVPSRAEAPGTLGWMGRLFGLTAFEQGVLALCLAVELDPEVEALVGLSQASAGHRLATSGLAMRLLLPSGDAALRWPAEAAFAEGAPLRRFRLVALEPPGLRGLLARPMRLEERVRDALLGTVAPDPRLQAWTRPVPLLPLNPALRALAAAAPEGARVVELLGPPRSGRRALAHAIAAASGLRLLELVPSRLAEARASEAGLAEALAVLAREAALCGHAYYLDDAAEELALVQAELVEQLEAPLLRGAAQAFPGAAPLPALHLPPPDAAARAALWRDALGADAEAQAGAIGAVVQQFRLGPTGVARTAAAWAASGRPAGGLWDAARAQAGVAMGGLARRLAPHGDWDALVMPPAIAAQLREVAAQVAARAEVQEGWGFTARGGTRGHGISLLLTGPPGVGKTLAAEVLAGVLGVEAWRVDLAGVVSKWIGETEKNLRRVFDAAEAGGALLFFDEADALFGKRAEVRDARDRHANIEIDYLLQLMEDHPGLAILATNRKGDLDPAFLRRLRFVLDIPFPDRAERRAIWSRVFPPGAPLGPLDLDRLAEVELPGSGIRSVALHAAFLAAAEGVPIGMAQCWQAARREFAKLERAPAGLPSPAEAGGTP